MESHTIFITHCDTKMVSGHTESPLHSPGVTVLRHHIPRSQYILTPYPIFTGRCSRLGGGQLLGGSLSTVDVGGQEHGFVEIRKRELQHCLDIAPFNRWRGLCSHLGRAIDRGVCRWRVSHGYTGQDHTLSNQETLHKNWPIKKLTSWIGHTHKTPVRLEFKKKIDMAGAWLALLSENGPLLTFASRTAPPPFAALGVQSAFWTAALSAVYACQFFLRFHTGLPDTHTGVKILWYVFLPRGMMLFPQIQITTDQHLVRQCSHRIPQVPLWLDTGIDPCRPLVQRSPRHLEARMSLRNNGSGVGCR
jgi:hypothetical protein